MSTSSGTDMHCIYCRRPIIGSALWGGAGPYHPECTRGPSYMPTYYGQPVGADDGCGTVIPRYLTEQEVRQIVRDELARASTEGTT